jgi:ATP-dependent exoDNAse (exonuclease V) beta subunit
VTFLADDRDARDQIRDDLDSTLVVEAAAGTGKTTALVSRIIEVVRRGKGELSRLVAVTFTEKAAGELKLRLRGELERARSRSRADGDAESARRLERGLAQLEEAHIGTIHGFCADLLRQRPLAAGVDPLFEVATEEEKERLYRRVFDGFLEDKLKDPPPGIRRLLRRQALREEGPVDDLYRAGLKLLDLRDFPTRWQIRPFDRDAEIDQLVGRALALADKAALAQNPRDFLFMDFADLIAFAQDLRGQEQVSGKRDYDALEHRLSAVKLKGRKGRGAYGPGAIREELLEERDSLKAAVTDFDQRARADLVAHLQNELSELIARYDVLKEKRGRLDFLDLLARARDLVKGEASIRLELQEAFSHVFVDEFQDTDPLQSEILLLLSADDPAESDWRRVRPVPGKLFVVADPKQSIYRFRRADVALYQQVKNQLVRNGAKALYLTVSFRSVPELQELVNSAMSDAMKRTAVNHQADYVPLSPARERIEGQPAAVALPVPRPYGDYGTVVFYAIQRSEPGAVASWLRWLLEESGWKVSSRGEQGLRPVRPSDVCLLFRRFVRGQDSVTQPYVDALQALDVPHVLVGGRGFHQREEIDAMRVALTAVERPDDELSVFSTLRGPLFSIPDESLFLFRDRHGPLHPFRALPEDDSSDSSVRDALDVLARLHKNRNHRPVAFTIRELLDATRAQAGFALWQAGDQVLANILRLMQIARTFEESGGLSFRGFIDHLDALADATERADQPVIEDGVDAVRLMTVHKAKGLEFPVVVLCDVTCSLSFGASRHVDPDRKIFAVRFAGGSPWELLDHEANESERDLAESMRLLYVAATRARDVLVVPVVADEPQESGWVGPLLKAIHPPSKNYLLPMVAPGCPRFSANECVIDRPSKAHILPGHGIRPGLHKPQRGRHTVVWWDPHLFEHAAETKPGLRRHWILKADPGDDEGKGAREYSLWLSRRDSLLESGSRQSAKVTTVSRLVEEDKAEVATVEGADAIRLAEVEGRDRVRPTGKRFGSLVHEVLARAALDAGREELLSVARSLGRAFDSPDEEVDAAVAAASSALRHPLVERARRAEALFRETPLVYRTTEGKLVEGVPDLVFRDTKEGGLTIVDFKTDLRPDMVSASYRNQVALYRLGLRDATGSPAEGWLLFV